MFDDSKLEGIDHDRIAAFLCERLLPLALDAAEMPRTDVSDALLARIRLRDDVARFLGQWRGSGLPHDTAAREAAKQRVLFRATRTIALMATTRTASLAAEAIELLLLGATQTPAAYQRFVALDEAVERACRELVVQGRSTEK